LKDCHGLTGLAMTFKVTMTFKDAMTFKGVMTFKEEG
jgi:hypothetical protein